MLLIYQLESLSNSRETGHTLLLLIIILEFPSLYSFDPRMIEWSHIQFPALWEFKVFWMSLHYDHLVNSFQFILISFDS